ncbi:MAG: CRTAC1 family protein [Acidobacteria bacterium]|nr:CRTAC1 family protein [Acidobacteriota bacterium]
MPTKFAIPFFLIVVLLAIVSAQQKTAIKFTDVTKSAGISFVHESDKEKRYIVESMSGGVAMFDFDNDGRLDIYLVNSYSVEATLAKKPHPSAALYRNLGNGKFEDVAAKAGVADPGWAVGVSVADFDNDGFDDLYVTCFGANKLYRNRGNGTFEDVTAKAGVGDARFSTGSAWADYDRDGDLDLFVANYVEFSLDKLPQFGKGETCRYRNVEVQCGPRGLQGAGDTLYRNNGDGTFTDVSKQAKVEDARGLYGLGVVWTDFDDDGWPDLFVANDTVPNYAYRNNHDGTFTETGFSLGVAVDENGNEQACMGITVGDYDRDGRLDLAVSNFSEDYNTIYHKNSDGTFTDVTRATKTVEPSLPYVGWGLKFFDADNDGWLDLFVANGHVYPQVEGAYPGGQYKQRKLFYRNLRDGTFAEIAGEVSAALLERRVSRGVAFGDYDEDGAVDLIVNELDGAPMLLRNELMKTANKDSANWVQLKLVGTKSNRNAVGAKVKLTAGKLTQVDEVRSGDSYLSHSDWRLHFGLAEARTVEQVEIQWPNGNVEKLKNLPVNQTLVVTEGKGWKSAASK